jgi:hypothetical protein
VVGFDTTGRIVGICMEGIEMGANTLGWGKVLGCGSSGLEDLVRDGLGLAFGLVGGWYVLHDGYRCTYLRWIRRGDMERADKNTYIEERAIQKTAHYDVCQILRIDDILRSALQSPTCRGWIRRSVRIQSTARGPSQAMQQRLLDEMQGRGNNAGRRRKEG